MVRRVLPLLLVLLLPAGIFADARVWTVQAGDALSLIAERFNVSVEDLRRWNEIEGDRINVGQQLRVSGEAAPASGPVHVVERGETLSHIAQRYNTTVQGLVDLNEGLNPDRLRAGMRLRVSGRNNRLRIQYRVRRGDNLARIAERHRVSVRQLRRWNRSLRGDSLRAGREIIIWSEIPESISASVGAPNRGTLANAERLPRHPGYFLRDRNRAWGTLETVLWIQDAFDLMRIEHPGAPQVRVHDLSNREGGPMRGHRSHQSGRDADITLYQKRCGNQPCPLRQVAPENLDAARQWTLISHWLENDRVEAIFLDYSLQEPLYNEARRRGVPRGLLRRYFQYPRGPSYPLGLVRHFPRHRNHLHVRFVCPDTDENCR